MSRVTVGHENNTDIEIYYKGPRHRSAGGANPWVSAQRALVGLIEPGPPPPAGPAPIDA